MTIDGPAAAGMAALDRADAAMARLGEPGLVRAAPIGLLDGDPVGMIADARRAAAELQRIIALKPKPVMMNGEQYLEFEDWQMLARFCGITVAEDGDPEYCEFGEARGFKASAQALDSRGRVISRATAYCLTDEEKWRDRPRYEWLYETTDGKLASEEDAQGRMVWESNPNKAGMRPKKQRAMTGLEPVPLFQLASMAQTRANAKCLRNCTSWIAVLGGYRPTPAEELQLVAVEEPEADARQGAPAAPTPSGAEKGSSTAPSTRSQSSQSSQSGERIEWSAKGEAFLSSVGDREAKLRAAFEVDHPVIIDIGRRLNRFGSINEKQIKFVLSLADEAGGMSYEEEDYGTGSGAGASSMSTTADPRVPAMGSTRLSPKPGTRTTVAVPDSPPPYGDGDVPF
jgi:hypothetical protein